MATVEVQQKCGLREPTEKILQYAWFLKKQGYAETTIESRTRILRRLVRLGASLDDPESVSETIAIQPWSNGRKELVAEAYDSFSKHFGLKWEKPFFKRIPRLPFVPLEREIDDLIAGCSRPTAVFLQLLKETGARAGEIFALRWEDVDFEAEAVRITPEKGGNARILRIKSKTLGMLNVIPKTSERVFAEFRSIKTLRKNFERQRKKIASKLSNPRLLRIHFHTFRHWKATTEYAKTRDILHVMKTLGHKNIKNTLVYTQLAEGLKDDEFVCRVAKTPEEIAKLIEAGFEYICEHEGLKFFRIRK